MIKYYKKPSLVTLATLLAIYIAYSAYSNYQLTQVQAQNRLQLTLLKDEVTRKKKELVNLMYSLDTTLDNYTGIQQKYALLKSKYDKLEIALSTTKSDFKVLQQQNLTLQESFELQIQAFQTQVDSLENNKNIIEEEVVSLKGELTNQYLLYAQMDSLKAVIKQQEGENNYLQMLLSRSDERIKHLEGQVGIEEHEPIKGQNGLKAMYAYRNGKEDIIRFLDMSKDHQNKRVLEVMINFFIDEALLPDHHSKTLVSLGLYRAHDNSIVLPYDKISVPVENFYGKKKIQLQKKLPAGQYYFQVSYEEKKIPSLRKDFLLQ